ncbi:hypothetical protein [Chitinimonas arctica]|uniref:hypothetical protein n=1 Tax=Chitinimonas arctica TaxID=2594795 RepID=UPI0015D19792|nr:hypothetical protein [Chitinimonas arctica]
MKKTYGVAIKQRTEQIKPVPMDLGVTEGSRVVLGAAKRVISTHEKVLKALAKR